LKAKNIITSTGTDRKNSTTTVLTQRIAGMWDRRPIPKTNPKAPASTIESAAAMRVFCRPGRR
jgi:hypothetical protein